MLIRCGKLIGTDVELTPSRVNPVGTGLGCGVAHGARHLYLPTHAPSSVGSDKANPSAAVPFSAANRTRDLAVSERSERHHGTSQVISMYKNADRLVTDRPF